MNKMLLQPFSPLRTKLISWLLTGILLGAMPAIAEETAEAEKDEELPELTVRVIEPNIKKDAGHSPDIDSENWEVGFYLGSHKFDGFPTQPMIAARLAYHFNYFMFLEATYGETEIDQSTLTDIGRDAIAVDEKATLYALDLGINFLNGQLFFGPNRALTSDLYLTFGAGRLNLDENDYTSINFAAGARALVNDWVTLRMEFRSHLLEESFLQPDELSHNIEFVVGMGLIF